jgi:hypothetical protein
MASPAEYGSVPAGDVHAELVSPGSTQKRWSMGKVIGAVLVVRERVPRPNPKFRPKFLGGSERTALAACHIRRGS